MPELPEVETVVRTLRPGLKGRTITRVRFGPKKLRRSGAKNWASLVVGTRIRFIRRRGKWIIIELSNGALLIHLGMTGQLMLGVPERIVEPHTHLFVDLNVGQLRFRDERRFGSVRYFASLPVALRFLDDQLGPEPFDIDQLQWQRSLAKTHRAIKAALLDQGIIAGVGNIYADESLFVSRIHPETPASRLTTQQAGKLRQAIADVLTIAIERRGSSIRNYRDGNGESGGFQSEFRVYGRFELPCPRCRTAIDRMRLAGRSTHFCPKCQTATE